MQSNVKVLHPSGILDGDHAERLRGDILSELPKGMQIFLIDLKEVKFLNSTAIGTLVTVLKEIRSAEGELYLCSLGEQVKIILELARMDRIFPCYKNVEEFEAKVLKPRSSSGYLEKSV